MAKNISGFLRYFVKNNRFLHYPIVKYRELRSKKRCSYLMKNGFQINEKIYQALNGKIVYYAWAGTLLGVIREKGFIPFDDDLDYSVRISNINEWRILREELEKVGFTLIHFFTHDDEIRECTFTFGCIEIDFFSEKSNDENGNIEFYYRNPHIIYNKDVMSVAKVFIKPAKRFSTITIHNSHFIVPDNYTEYLEANYGGTWMTPQKGIKSINDCGTRTKYDNILAEMRDSSLFNSYFK